MWLARLDSVELGDAEPPAGSVQDVLDEATLVLPLGDVIDLDQERARLRKTLDKRTADKAKIERKLNNQQFLDKAPEEVIEEQRERLSELEASIAKLREALDRIRE